MGDILHFLYIVFCSGRFIEVYMICGNFGTVLMITEIQFWIYHKFSSSLTRHCLSELITVDFTLKLIRMVDNIHDP